MNNRFPLEQLKKYENKWVAILEPDRRKIVASGENALEAKKEAEKKGYNDVILMKILPFRMGYIPSFY